MRWLKEIARRLPFLLHRDRAEQDLDQEIRAHLDIETDENIAAGLPPEEARYAARRAFGNVTSTKEFTRDVWLFRWWENLLQDVRYGARTLVRSPSYSAAVIVTLALGIAASTIVFSIADAALLHPIGKVDHDRLVAIYSRNLKGIQAWAWPPDYLDWKRQAQSFEQLEAWQGRAFTLSDGERLSRVYSYRVSEGFFRLLAVEAQLGRTLSSEDFTREEPVVVLSHRFWKNHFGEKQEVIGSQVRLRGWRERAPALYTVVGVLPDFELRQSPTTRGDLYVPLVLTEEEKSRTRRNIIGILARLKPGVSVEHADAEMRLLAERLAQRHPDTHEGRSAMVIAADEDLADQIRPVVLALIASVLCLMLIACLNAANLLFGRGATRTREMAIRTACGGGRVRLIGQMVTESLMLSLTAGVLGTLVAYGGLQPLLLLIPEDKNYPGLMNVVVDGQALLFASALAALTGLVFSLGPAVAGSSARCTVGLQEGGRELTGGTASRRIRKILVATEAMLALVLLAGAGLTIQSLARLEMLNPGFDPGRVLTFSIEAGWFGNADTAHFYREARSRIEAVPGVRAASLVNPLPFYWPPDPVSFQIVGREQMEQHEVAWRSVAPGFFQLLGIPLQQGRDFMEDEWATSEPNVILVNAAAARQHWPGTNPVGSLVRIGDGEEQFSEMKVIGIVGDARLNSLSAEASPEIYRPLGSGFAHFVIATEGDPLNVKPDVEHALWSVNKNVPLRNPRPMETLISGSLWQMRVLSTVLSLLALLALVLAGGGVYAVMSYSVRCRTKEIGIRTALGAQRGEVARMVAIDGLKPATVGLVGGIALSFILVRIVSSWLHGLENPEAWFKRALLPDQRRFLYGVTADDPVTFAAVSLLLLTTAAAGCWLPARRAAKVDPMDALRHE